MREKSVHPTKMWGPPAALQTSLTHPGAFGNFIAVTLTIDIPDSLAEQLGSERERVAQISLVGCAVIGLEALRCAGKSLLSLRAGLRQSSSSDSVLRRLPQRAWKSF